MVENRWLAVFAVICTLGLAVGLLGISWPISRTN